MTRGHLSWHLFFLASDRHRPKGGSGLHADILRPSPARPGSNPNFTLENTINSIPFYRFSVRISSPLLHYGGRQGRRWLLRRRGRRRRRGHRGRHNGRQRWWRRRRRRCRQCRSRWRRWRRRRRREAGLHGDPCANARRFHFAVSSSGERDGRKEGEEGRNEKQCGKNVSGPAVF